MSASFAAALILDQLWWGGFQLASPHALVVLLALWVLFRPSSVVRFAALIAVNIAATAVDLPVVGDHRLLELICGVVVLGYLGWTTLRARRVPTAGAVFAGIAPFLRASLIVVYAFAALAKMNTAFFDPVLSCAAWMSHQVVWFDPSLLSGQWQVEPAIWGTVLIEVALPILLAIRRTRLFALLLGVGFHTVLALAGNVPFTALAFTFYVAFLPSDTPERARALLAWRGGLPPWVDQARSWRYARPVIVAALVGGWLVGAALGPTKTTRGLLGTPAAQMSTVIGDGTRLVVVGLAAVGIVLLVSARAVPGRPPMRPRRPLWVGHPILAVGILVLVINGSCPYLGLKTDTSFAMFSGLRTEPGAWNHLVVPEAVRVFGYQDHLVRVEASNDPALVARSSGGTRLARLELDRYIRSHPGTVATYNTSGEQGARTLGPIAAGPTVAERIAAFHDVPPPGHGGC
ncbi:MAG: HTTM domain-containing protein [Actinomycetota bacterium]|nr:HTTM domain-containing protein [Actinomycetota bacterium]